MKHTTMTELLRRSALLVALLVLVAGTASAQTYNLVADQYIWNGTPMWGFRLDTSQPCNSPPFNQAWAIGPMLEVDAATTGGLTVNLRNCLTEPVSIVIPGLPMPALSTPTMTTDGLGRSRAASFTTEAGPNGGSASYSWSRVEPGTYLYHSGSNPAKQVQMGLYGSLIIDADHTTGEAYPGIFYDTDVVIVFSEIDPALHNPPAAATPLGFKPKYFLVNGVATGATSVTNLLLNQQVLLRFVNAGLNTYVPNLLGEYMDWLAEDGNQYAYAKISYSGLLAAGKTMDAMWSPVTPGAHKLYDRRLFLTQNGVGGGGLITTLTVDSPAGTPIANAGPDQQNVPNFTGGLPTVVTLDGTLSVDTGPDTGPPASRTRTAASDMTYAWAIVAKPIGSAAAVTPATGVNNIHPTFTIDVPGTYAVSLQVTDLPRGPQTTALTSGPDTVVIYTNLAPVALFSSPATANVGSPVALNASATHDPDGNPIVSYAWTVIAPDTTTQSLTGVTTSFTPTQTGDYTVELVASDFELASAPKTVIVAAAVAVNQPPVAAPDYATAVWCKNNDWNAGTCPATSTVVIDILANDQDLDGIAGIDITSVTIVTQPTQGGSVVKNLNGTVTYTVPQNWRGTDAFVYTVRDTLGLVSNPATVLVNVVK